ncbi:PP2C family protein-serine/threonine phosphatase [Actinacidiphila yeochonensis]|uniref:PP2C family protein-serine/threonine phosphatase n=1 Tax=Actinacidiphila yeochonensis TaxID=89050 RepID=UPI00068C1F12|nr:PP2C family protein-serine/threonine phosphatase [Actinacidiphila yeochonensis]
MARGEGGAGTGRRRVVRWRRPFPTAEPSLRVRDVDVTWLLPLLLLVAIAFLDWNSSGEFRVVTWIVLVPLTASALSGPLPTLVFAVLAPLVYLGLDRAWPSRERMGAGDFLLVVACGVGAVVASWLRLRAGRRTLRMQDAAEATRNVVLRPIPQGIGGLDLADVYLAADSQARIGGDFYDVVPSPHGARVILGDVQGKGIGAVSAAGALAGTFREAGWHEPDLAVVAGRLEQRMLRNNAYMKDLGTPADRFATAVLISFPPPGPGGTVPGWIELVNCGHEAPLALSRREVRALPSGTGAPLGLARLTGLAPRTLRVPFGPDETLLLFTDGVTEARDRHGEFLPLRAVLERALAADPAGATTPRSLVALVEAAVRAHSVGALHDDTAILAVRRLRPAIPAVLDEDALGGGRDDG